MPRCIVTDDNTDSTGNAVDPVFSTGRDGADDGGPRPRTRGSHAGFLPDNLAEQLRLSASSGAGLAYLPQSNQSRGNSLLLILAVTGLFLAVRNGRST